MAGKYGAIGLTATADVVFNLFFLKSLLNYSNANKEIVGPKIVIAVLFIQISSTFILNFSCQLNSFYQNKSYEPQALAKDNCL